MDMLNRKPFVYAMACALLLGLAACGERDPETRDDTRPAEEDTSSADGAYTERMAEQHAEDSTTPSGAVALGEIPEMAVVSETVEYGLLRGERLNGYLAYPETAHGGLPGILVFHEWWGLNDNIRAMADKLAGQGYVVLAVDLYGGQVAETPEQARELMQQTLGNRDALNGNIQRAWKYMTEEIGALSVASLGWCLGGTLAFNTALLYPDRLAGTVIYYGFVTDVAPEQLAPLQMPILGLFGADDGGIPVEGVRQFAQRLDRLGKDAEIVIYEGAGHAFANPSGQNFEPEAAEDAWQKTVKFLDRTLNAAVNRNLLEEENAAGF